MKIFTSAIIAITALMTSASNIQSADIQSGNNSSTTSRSLLSSNSVTQEQFNLEQSFSSCNKRKFGCVIIHGKPTSSCRQQCAMNMQQLLKNEGLVTQLRSFYDSGELSACVGYRPDLGGNRMGAQYIANLLTERLGVKYVVSNGIVVVASCGKDGWPYSVILH